MPVTKTQLTGGVFQDSQGNVLANGYLIFSLNQDNSVTGVCSIAAGIEIKVLLNSSGSVATSPAQYIWATDVMVTANAYYRVTGYTSQGQPAWGPNNQQVISAGVGGGTFDVGTWVPNSVFSWTPPNQPLSLETNSVKNTSQILLNLIAGSNITLAEIAGAVTIAASSPSAIALKTNGSSNSDQTQLNLANGNGTTVTNVAGTTTIDGVVLKTDGVSNSDQKNLDLAAGSNITLSNVAGVTTISSSGGGGISAASVTLFPADLYALRSTPFTLVAGSLGRIVVPIFYQAAYTFNTTPFSGCTGNVFNIFPGTDITLQWDYGIRLTGFLDQSTNLIAFATAVAPINQSTFPVPVAPLSFTGKGLSIGFGQAQGPAPLSVGDGSVHIVVYYYVL